MYIVLVNGKLAETATMDPVIFLLLQPKNYHLYSCTGVGMSTPAKKDYDGIKSVTCPFNDLNI